MRIRAARFERDFVAYLIFQFFLGGFVRGIKPFYRSTRTWSGSGIKSGIKPRPTIAECAEDAESIAAGEELARLSID